MTQAHNEPLPNPEDMSSNDRIRAINDARTSLNSGHIYPPEHLRWLISLIRIERAGSSSRQGAAKPKSPAGPPPSIDDL